jgi:hypothetical protein
MVKSGIPYEFVLDYLKPVEPCVKPIFGSFGLYVQDQLVLYLRSTHKHPELNGIYVGTTPVDYDSLTRDIPAHYHEQKDNTAKTWIFLPESAKGFQKWARKACDLIKQGDRRIGRSEM